MRSDKDDVTSLKVVREFLWRTRPTWSDVCDSDYGIYLDSLCLTVTTMMDITSTREPFHRTQWNRWVRNCAAIHPLELCALLKDSKSLLVAEKIESYETFKQSLVGRFPFIGAVMAPMKETISDWCLTSSAFSFTIFNQFISFICRINICPPDATIQEEDFIRRDELLKLVHPDETLLASLNKIARNVFRRWPETPFVPAHGPGGVADMGRCSVSEKYRRLGSDTLLRYSFRNGAPLSHDFDQDFPCRSASLKRRSEVVFVPKSMGKLRTICMEPATLQYFQQGVWRVLDDYLSSSMLYSRIHVHDQSFNRLLAQRGSLHSEYCTIDLSNASDTISLEVVKRVFRGTWILPLIIGTRSQSALLPSGKEIRLNKCFPMGSALCFPMESVLFALCVQHVAMENRGTHELFYVYGDDIVAPSRFYIPICDVLSQLGFEVNMTKSFSTGSFRESCGGEYFAGSDVTPLRLPRNFPGLLLSRKSFSPSTFTCLIDLANAFFVKQMVRSRLYVLETLLSLPKHLKPLFGDRYLLSTEATNFHLDSRWNSDLQYTEFHHGRIVTSYGKSTPEDEKLRLFEWLRSSESTRPHDGRLDHLGIARVARVARPRTRLSTGWTFAPTDNRGIE